MSVKLILLLLLFTLVTTNRVHAQQENLPELESTATDFDEFDDEFNNEAESAQTKEARDPLRGFNRAMYRFNDKMYFWLVRPIAKGYRKVLSVKIRTSIGRAFHNLAFPIRFANSILQFNLKKSTTELGRFVVNSTVGIGGFLDPAGKHLKWYSFDEDFGQTLGYYGIGGGFPLVLPLLGPSNLRDALGLIPDHFAKPLNYYASWELTYSLSAAEAVNRASLSMGRYESLKKDALDPYTFMRDAYKQNRDKKIKE
ncbi:VacJ family lipoprotein [Elusimicrobiota bacterium]